jgi:hypothetical protein
MTEPMFQFAGRWKEELVATGAGGSFVLEMPIGILSVYLPPEAEWQRKGPDWARPHWHELKLDLEAWCAAANAVLHIDPTATVYSL